MKAEMIGQGILIRRTRRRRDRDKDKGINQDKSPDRLKKSTSFSLQRRLCLFVNLMPIREKMRQRQANNNLDLSITRYPCKHKKANKQHISRLNKNSSFNLPNNSINFNNN